MILCGFSLVTISSLLFFRNILAWSPALIMYELGASCFAINSAGCHPWLVSVRIASDFLISGLSLVPLS